MRREYDCVDTNPEPFKPNVPAFPQFKKTVPVVYADEVGENVTAIETLFPAAIVSGREGYFTVKLEALECTRCNVRGDELLFVNVADMVCELPMLTWPNCSVEGLDANAEACAEPPLAIKPSTPNSATRTDFDAKWGRFIATSVSG